MYVCSRRRQADLRLRQREVIQEQGKGLVREELMILVTSGA